MMGVSVITCRSNTHPQDLSELHWHTAQLPVCLSASHHGSLCSSECAVDSWRVFILLLWVWCAAQSQHRWLQSVRVKVSPHMLSWVKCKWLAVCWCHSHVEAVVPDLLAGTNSYQQLGLCVFWFILHLWLCVDVTWKEFALHLRVQGDLSEETLLLIHAAFWLMQYVFCKWAAREAEHNWHL